MQICRFDEGRIGWVAGDRVHDITERVGPLLDARRERGDPLVLALPAIAALPAAELERQPALPLATVQLRSPVARPGKIVAAPVNYRAHIAEMKASNVSPGFDVTDIGRAGLFLKAPSALVGCADGVAQRFLDRRTDHEVELVAVIGRTADRVRAEDALGHVAAYALGLDITVRGPEERSFRKSIDSYAVLGPWLTTADEVGDPGAIEIRLERNHELRQRASTADMVFGVARLIEFASSFYTLEPGDLLYTGTPEGVGPIRPGDLLVASGTGLGRMSVLVREA